MRTRWATPRCAARLLVLLLQCFELAKPSRRAGNDPFTIINENTGKCIKPLNDWIVAKDCDKTDDMLWKWVSQHRLFHLQSQKCLGLDITKPMDSLKMFSCDSNAMLWWKCEHHSLYGAAQSRLALKDGHAIASTNSSDGWKKGGSEENLCDQPYHEIYTRDGNSYGRPCEFPFFVAGTWHHECIRDKDHSGPWCATSLNYEYDQKWGICLNPEDGCEDNWEKNEKMGSCYQFNTQAALSWKEAYVSCQNQGADLLSIGSAAELNYLKEKEGIGRTFWIGLNQLYSSRGWEWSDHMPLNFLNWDPDMPSAPITGSSCARMDATSGLWQRFPCGAQLPYICKKSLNNTVELTDIWTYSDTRCDADWLPDNGFCYLLANGSDAWGAAQATCRALSSDLISVHSLADVEAVVTKLHKGDAKEETWTGLKNINTPALFQWSDGTEVTLTYWDENEPVVPYNKTPNCVSYLGKLGQWKVQSCEEKLKYVCKKKGEKMSDARLDKMCPPEEGWKRHGETCYKIYKDEVPFGTNCNLTITSRFEQEYLNDMIKKYTKSPEKYFWTGLRDEDSLGEYSWASVGGVKWSLTFSNWNFLEPASPGGCVAMSAGSSLGKWEVKDCRSFRALSICKRLSGPAEPEKAAPKPEEPCPEGWHSLPSSLSCYKLFHIERVVRKRNWEEAEKFCQALGGHLPSFYHANEIKEFLHFLMDQFSGERWLWIGLNKRSPDLQGSWQWSDLTPVSTLLMENEFQQDYDIRDCAAVKVVQRLWRRRSWYYHNDREFIYLRPLACDTKLEWVCQIPKGHTPKTPDWYNPEHAGSHGPSVVIEGSEYWFVAEPRLTYEEAVLYCGGNHSSLAALTSFAGLKAIKNKIANISGYEQKWWVRTTEKPIIDHRYMFFEHPWHHFPTMFGEECVYISVKTWFNEFRKPIDCNTRLPFICENYNVSSLEKYSPDSAAKIQCSGAWMTFQNKCFLKIKPKSLRFSEASDTCHTYGGTLPTVLSQREQDFITSLLPEMEDDLWIGLRWTAYERISKWIDGQELTFSNFHPLLVGRMLRIPKNVFDEESRYHCALMLNHRRSPFTGTWNFTSCSERHTVSLCQKYSEIEDRQTLQNTSETVKYLNNLYKIILKPLTWPEALRECQKANMRLVTIMDPYQQAFLTVQAVLRNSSLWIGLSSQDDELNFGWSDGKHLQFSRWAENNEQLEDCVFLDTDGFWKTSDCDANQPGAICYYPANETEKEVKPVNSIRCPSPVLNTPWIPFQNYCYNFMIAKNRYMAATQDDVHSRCQKLNPKSHILSIRDEKENNFVLEQLLHLNYMASWVMLGLIYENNSLMWSDKTMLSYTNWRAGRPAVNHSQFFAGLRTDGFWDIHTFNAIEEILYFHQHSILACKIEMVDYKEEYNTTLPQFIPYEDGIYSVIQKTVTWYEAINTCSQSGGHLASVHDQKGQLFLEDIAKRDGFPLWVGLSSHDGIESDFEWSDGSAFDYIPWKDKQSAGNCVLLDPKGIWKHEKCSSLKDGAICYKSTKSKEVSSYTHSSRCPAGKGNESQWVQYRDHCYTSNQALHSFSDAKQFCSELDHSATIVTIKNEDENKFVSGLMRENNNITMRVWLGLFRYPTSQSWNWLDGSKVTFVKWADKRKSDAERCSVLLASDETWTKVECSRGYGRVICKVPLGPDYRGIATIFAVLSVLALVSGLVWFLWKRNRLHWGGFSSVRYQQGMNDDEIMLPSFHD